LIPLYVCVGAGCLGALFYSLRLATRNPDVQWNRTGEISNEEFRTKQYKLIPLYVCVGAGCLGALFYSLRLATRNPDVQWNRTGEISNEEFRTKQYKVHNMS
ncbi:hypothetical protein YQE_04610, partial [Dendroctonus ponderosae]